MKSKILLCLIFFTISAKSVHSKTFFCNERSISNKCTITKVPANETIISLPDYTINELTILNSKLDDIPDFLASDLNLYEFYCIGCGLKDITNHSFHQLNSLITLDISFGSFGKLEKNLFSQLSEIEKLDVAHGSVAHIDDMAFENLGNLYNLDLSFNKIPKITPTMFTTLKSLQFISLSHNHIKTIDEGLFINNKNLTHVLLDHNDISRIDGKLFNPQHILHVISLSDNLLTTLNSAFLNAQNVWVESNKLKRLSISSSVQFIHAKSNDIHEVVCDTKSNQISELYIQNNSLNGLGCIGSLVHLTSLNLNNNNIGKLDKNSFAGLTKLKSLNLKSTNIGKLEVGVFALQDKLINLDISYNHMGNIAVDVLLPAKNLQYLYIDGNNITEFPYLGLKTNFAKLRTIGIGDNDFNCTFLRQAVKWLNTGGIDAVVSSGNRVIDSHHVKGVGCRHENSMENTTNAELNLKLDPIIRQVETLSNLNNRVAELKQKLDSNIQKVETISAHAVDHFNSDYATIRNFNIILLTVVVAFCLYAGYKFVRNDFPLIKRYITLRNDVEMDNSSM